MPDPTDRALQYSGVQLTVLVTLRMLIGWHLLYEGLSKILNPYWTSAGYLAESQWLFAPLFERIAGSPTLLAIADGLTQWGLLLIGLALMLGLFTRLATVLGAVLLLLFYLCAPPLGGLTYSMPTEGSYLVVNKTLIEAVALWALYVLPTGHLVGVDSLLARRTAGTTHPATA